MVNPLYTALNSKPSYPPQLPEGIFEFECVKRNPKRKTKIVSRKEKSPAVFLKEFFYRFFEWGSKFPQIKLPFFDDQNIVIKYWLWGGGEGRGRGRGIKRNNNKKRGGKEWAEDVHLQLNLWPSFNIAIRFLNFFYFSDSTVAQKRPHPLSDISSACMLYFIFFCA